MYLRAAHAELDVLRLHQFIRANPLGILVTAIPSSNYPTIQSSHFPWLLDVSEESNGTELGKVRGHMARQNPHAKALIEALQSKGQASSGVLEQEVMILFNGPAHSYVTPKFYRETKPQTGKVVPTWNYSAAQIYGTAKVYFDAHDPETTAFLQTQVTELTNYAEETVMTSMGGDTSSTWAVSDAPESYIDILRKNIIGIEVEIDRLEGRVKMSQEMPKGDRDGIVNGFKALNTDCGNDIARTVEERGALKDGKASTAVNTK